MSDATNVTSITVFVLFVAASLSITYWAARRTRSAGDFYTAGGNITGFQNGLALAGDFMSAATFLGITGLAFIGGADAMLFTVGITVGWAIILFVFAANSRAYRNQEQQDRQAALFYQHDLSSPGGLAYYES